MFGVYPTSEALAAAVEALRAKGFRNSDISVVSATKPELSALVGSARAEHTVPAGPSSASAIGGTLGWLVGMSALAMAGSVFIVAGPIMSALAHIGETAGGVAGALTGYGVPADAAAKFENHITSGGMLLSVHTDDPEWFSRGQHILEQTGADGITATPFAHQTMMM